MNRTDIINYFIKRKGYSRYLEIGVKRVSINFDKIKCDFKDGVDPASNSGANNIMTSDNFFKDLSIYKMYDIIFIDGLHESKQVLRDIENSLNHLSKDGSIIVHDCNPIRKKDQEVPRNKSHSRWNGDVWKAFARLRMSRDDLTMKVIDTDDGCGIIRIGGQKLFDKVISDKKLNYKFLKRHRKELLNLCPVDQFELFFKEECI